MDVLKMSSLKSGNGVYKSLEATSVKLTFGHVLAFTFLIPTLRFLYLDYQQFLSLGPGGTPKTITGYVRVKCLGLFALKNPYEPPSIPPYITQKAGCLPSLPQRSGPRPATRGIAPHRQINQFCSTSIFEKLSTAIKELARENIHLEEGTSCFEKHGTGLFSNFPKRRTCRGEICHAHPSDGSLHLTLHPADAKTMLEAGWGERHPLAKGGWFEKFVPGGFVMIYAPRDEQELEVVMELIRAAAWWVGGEEVKIFVDARRDSGYESGDFILAKGDLSPSIDTGCLLQDSHRSLDLSQRMC